MKRLTYPFNKRRVIFTLLLVFAIAISGSFISLANRAGISGRTSPTGNGCGACHGTAAGATSLSAKTESGLFRVSAGGTLTITVSVVNSTLSVASIDIAVKTDQSGNTNIGTLDTIAGQGMKFLNSELVHSVVKNITASKADFQFKWTAPAAPGTYYLRAAGCANVNDGAANASDQWNFLAPIAITVTAPGTITVGAPNGTESYCAGEATNITWTSSGVDNVRIDLSTDGGTNYTKQLAANLPATDQLFTWLIPDTLTGSTTCKIRVADALNLNVKDASDANFTLKTRTAITLQPVDDTTCSGQNAMFCVKAKGENLSYRWFFNGNALPTQTKDTIKINAPDTSKAGYYYCEVLGDCGAVAKSNRANLFVNMPVTIANQPIDQIVCTGEKAVFKVHFDNPKGLSFQWYHNDINIPGATDSILNIPNTVKSDSGSYYVVITAPCPPPVTSAKAMLIVNHPPSIIDSPKSQTVTEGDSAVFSVTATELENEFLWYKGAKVIGNERKPRYVIYNVQLADSGDYYCSVFNKCGDMSSPKAKLTVLPQGPGPIITLSVPSVNFGTVMLGSYKDSAMTAVIKNTGSADLNISAISITGKDKADFLLVPPTYPLKIAIGATKDLNLTFSPKSAGQKFANLEFTSDAKAAPVLALRGFSGFYKIFSNDTIINFGDVTIGSAKDDTVKLENQGNMALTVQSIDVSPTYKDVFLITDPQPPFIIDSAGFKNLIITFKPKMTGTAFTEIPIKIQNISNDLIIQVLGRGKGSGVEDITIDRNLTIEPNPAAAEAFISFECNAGEHYRMIVSDISGRELFNLNGIADVQGLNKIQWNIGQTAISSGLYQITVITSKKIYSASISIAK